MLIEGALRPIGLVAAIDFAYVVPRYLHRRPPHPFLLLPVGVQTLITLADRIDLFFMYKLFVYERTEVGNFLLEGFNLNEEILTSCICWLTWICNLVASR